MNQIATEQCLLQMAHRLPRDALQEALDSIAFIATKQT